MNDYDEHLREMTRNIFRLRDYLKRKGLLHMCGDSQTQKDYLMKEYRYQEYLRQTVCLDTKERRNAFFDEID